MSNAYEPLRQPAVAPVMMVLVDSPPLVPMQMPQQRQVWRQFWTTFWAPVAAPPSHHLTATLGYSGQSKDWHQPEPVGHHHGSSWNGIYRVPFTNMAGSSAPLAGNSNGGEIQLRSVPLTEGTDINCEGVGKPKVVNAMQDGGQKISIEPELTDKQKKRKALLPFVIISLSYLLFTITDGSVRMIVLLHAYNLKFTAMEVAIMFTLYEMAGVVTNLLAGIAGAKWGIKFTLLFGLSFQFVGLGMLYGWNPDWEKGTAIIYVTIAQMMSGISKDLTKLGGKTVTKLVTPDEKQGQLFKLVSWITGFKNSLKGVGYFIGAACISAPLPGLGGYYLALGVNAFLIFCAIPWAAVGLSRDLGTAKSKNATLYEALFSGNHNLNWLSFARTFLFASRDLWFEVPLPFYLRAPVCTDVGRACLAPQLPGGELYCPYGGTSCVAGVCENVNVGGGCGGLGLSRVFVGTFLALYIIIYGQMQAAVPWLVLQPLKQSPPNKYVEIVWGLINLIPTLALWCCVLWGPWFIENVFQGKLITLIVCIVVFALVFAVNSSIHSYLVVRYAEGNKVATSVGFYYMSNAVGRLCGTLLSGGLYSTLGWNGTQNNVNIGISWCFFAGTVSSIIAAIITVWIRDDAAGLRCGGCICVDGVVEEEKGGEGGEE